MVARICQFLQSPPIVGENSDYTQNPLPKASMRVIDSMTMSAPWTRVNFGGANQPRRPGRKEPNNDHYRMRLPPGLSTNCFCGYRKRGTARAATGPSRGSGEVLP